MSLVFSLTGLGPPLKYLVFLVVFGWIKPPTLPLQHIPLHIKACTAATWFLINVLLAPPWLRTNLACSLFGERGGASYSSHLHPVSLRLWQGSNSLPHSLLLSSRLKSLIEDFHVAAEKLCVNYSRQQQCPLQVRIVWLKCWDSLVSGCCCCHCLVCDFLLLDMLIISLFYNEQIQIMLAAFWKGSPCWRHFFSFS